MTDAFWSLIESARAGTTTCCEVAAKAAALLATRPPAEIVATHQALWRLMDASYVAPLWAAAFLIRGGCSDDGFDYFRGWLLTRGRQVFEAAVADPDSLAGLTLTPDLTGRIGTCENTLSLAQQAHEAATGEDLPDAAWEPGNRPALDPSWDFDFEDGTEMRQRLPRLAAVHLS
ncbi:DUF4240 domain-containing protein [Lentzea sp. NPDC034063]|uniref:DUF4240 domain-containing protein n=1 Tax=unclassified Lentzea TaxID=2643253 RepID=UPI0033E277C3